MKHLPEVESLWHCPQLHGQRGAPSRFKTLLNNLQTDAFLQAELRAAKAAGAS